MKSGLLSVLFCCILSALFAGEGKVLLYGYVVEGDVESAMEKDRRNAVPIAVSDVTVQVFSGDTLVLEQINRQSGFYSLVLPTGIDFQISFKKEGFISKNFQVLGSSVPEGEYEEAFKLFTDVSMFPESGKATEMTCGKLVSAQCLFDSRKKRMSWDIDHAIQAFEQFMSVAAPHRMAMEGK